MGVGSTCTVVWLRGVSGGIQKCHMQTYLYVMVINNKSIFINQASILIEDTMVIRVEGSRNLLSREDLQ